MAFAQSSTVSGTVTDQTGDVLPGVNVVVKGTTNGSITDINGKYTITNMPQNAILVFSFIGMTSIEITVGAQSVVNAKMTEDALAIGEVTVVAVGYGTMRKKDLTGAVSSISTEKLKAELPRTVQEILRGNISGLDVGFSTRASGGGDFLIRGKSSLKASTTPLIVRDGIIFQGSINDINPFDIQTIDVLKDGSATAVYGTKAANGVILITTTKNSQSKKPTVNFSSNIGYAEPVSLAKVYSAYDFITWRQDVLRSMNWYSSPGNQKLYIFENPSKLPSGISMEQWMDGQTGDPEEIWLSRLGLRSLEIRNYKAGKFVDWEKEVYQKGSIQDYNVSVSGAKEDVNYYWSMNYASNDGIIVGDWYKSIRSLLKLDFDITNWLSAGVNTMFTEKHEGAEIADRWQVRQNSPWGSKYEEDGKTLRHSSIDDPQGSTNPLYTMSHTDQFNVNRILNTNIFGTIKLPYNITFTTTFSPFYSFRDRYYHYSSEHVDYRAQGGQATRQNTTIFNWQLDNLLKWSHTFNNTHKFDFTFLYGAEKNQFWQNYMSGRGFSPTDILGYHAMASASLVSISSNDTYSTGNSLMGRLFYSFSDKYMLTTSIRRDGYSAFGQSNPYATFPSIALAWVFSEEKFFPFKDVFYGKLRATWGANGNREIGIYDALSSMSVDKITYANQNGAAYESVLLYIGNMSNKDLKWEHTKSTNIGLDYSILNNLISGSFEVYDARTNDLLVSRALPNVTGYNNVTTNLGEIQNRGLEMNLNAQLMKKKDFTWRASLTFSLNRNKIISLYGDMEDVLDANGNVIGQKESDDITNRWFIGQALDRIWDPKVLGIWQQNEYDQARVYGQYPGDFKVLDVNNDNRISQEDNVFQGYTNPRFRWNMRHDFNLYKNFNFSFNLYSYWGHYGGYNDVAKDQGKNDRTNDVAYPYWTPEKPYEQWYGRIGTYNAGSGFTVWRKKSFVRLENITLSYRVPSKITERINLNNVSISGTARNVGFWAPEWDYGDPEIDSGYPVPRQFSLGINITF